MRSLEWVDGKLKYFDQARLPLEEFFCKTDDILFVAEAVKRLAICSAPLVVISAYSITTT
jgi:methylthioribose-1-phosphate isomerase